MKQIEILKDIYNICLGIKSNKNKYKKDLGGLFVLLGFTWQVFRSISSSYTPTQAILVVIFAYIGVRLTYFVYFKNN